MKNQLISFADRYMISLYLKTHDKTGLKYLGGIRSMKRWHLNNCRYK